MEVTPGDKLTYVAFHGCQIVHMTNFVCTTHVYGCHGNHAFVFIVQKSLSLRTKNLYISGVPMNDLAPMKNCPWGCKVGQISSRGIRKCLEYNLN